ncbi:MFS transporter [Hoeflea sp.]|uniref:MFS transporter n=1 Tax=Hoeflea sp. TaxID=1940281 RepID=UPI003B012C53
MDVERLDRNTIIGLFAMAIGTFVVANDFTALSVAIPAIEKSFNTDLTTAQWVINSYAMVFGVVIVTGGRLADIFGRRRIFLIGAAIFAIFSVIGGLAPDVRMLLICRGIMGIGGALMWPAVLGMTFEIVPDNRAGLAGGLVIGVAGIGNAMGPLLGGTLTDTLGWQWIFYINAPVALLGIVTVLLVIPRDKPTGPNERIDYGGIAILTVGLLAWLLALDWGVDRGWTNPVILFLFALGAVAVALFGLWENRMGETALIPTAVMRNLTFAVATLTTLMIAAVFFGALLYLPQYMTKALGFSAVGAGAGLLPMMLTFALVSFVAGRVYEILGAKLIVSVGAACLAGGMFLLSSVHTGTTYGGLVPGMLVLGIGIGLFYSSVTTAAVTALDPSRASLAGAIIYMVNVAGGAIGLGLNTAIVASAGTLIEGIRAAFIVNGSLALIGLVIAALFIGGPIDKGRLRSLRHHYRAHN